MAGSARVLPYGRVREPRVVLRRVAVPLVKEIVEVSPEVVASLLVPDEDTLLTSDLFVASRAREEDLRRIKLLDDLR